MITEQQAREFLINLINAKTYEQVDFNERSLLLYFRQQEKVEELLKLYQKKEQCIVCVPVMKDSPILHCVVRYSDDEKYMRILNQIKQLEEELK